MSLFQSTHPLRGATGRRAALDGAHGFQSTHPLRGATYRHGTIGIGTKISIHAPLAGCDEVLERLRVLQYISIHAPLAGCDSCAKILGLKEKFQSTHPLRGATVQVLQRRLPQIDFNPRTPCGVRLLLWTLRSKKPEFQSTHPLRGATSTGALLKSLFRFQSTHPLRGATAKLPKYSRQICEKATKFLQSRTKSGVAACWAKGKRLLFPTLRGANLPEKTGTLPVRIR